jgi:hypothetical protein
MRRIEGLRRVLFFGLQGGRIGQHRFHVDQRLRILDASRI